MRQSDIIQLSLFTLDTKRPLKSDDFEGEFLMGNSTVDIHHDPSKEVLDAGRGQFVLFSCLSFLTDETNGKSISSDLDLYRSSKRVQQGDSNSLQEGISCPIQVCQR